MSKSFKPFFAVRVAPAVSTRSGTILLAGLLGAVALAYTQLNKKPLVAPASAQVPQPQGFRVAKTGTRRTPTSESKSFKNPPPQELIDALEADFARARVPRDNAQRLLREGKLKAAEAECRRAMTLVPRISGKPWYGEEMPLLGDILLAQGRNREALACYLRVSTSSIPDNPKQPRPNLNAALAYCRMGNFALAKKYYPPQTLSAWFSANLPPVSQAMSNIRAMEASILLLRGLNLKSCADDEGALPYLQAANKLAPHNWLIIYDIADSLHDLNRREEAIPYYRTMIRLRGDKTPYEVRMRVEMYDLYQKHKRK